MSWSQSKNPYLVTVVGAVLMAIGEVVGTVRGMMFRAMLRPGGFNGTGGGLGTGFSGGARLSGGFGFGLTSDVTIIGLIIVIVGIVWLGMTLRKTTNP